MAERRGRHRAPRARSDRLLLASLALVLAGGILLGWASLRSEEQEQVARRDDRVAAGRLDRDAERIEAALSTGATLAKGEVGVLRIPRFDQGGRAFAAPVIAGWDDADLARGVGLSSQSVRPGERGNVVIAGHRVTHGSPFADFHELQVGDTVELRVRDRVITYRLISSGTRYRVPDTTRWPTYPTPTPAGRPTRVSGRFLTLVTCAETFHTELRNVAVAVQVGERDVPATRSG